MKASVRASTASCFVASFALALFPASAARASTIAVIDSGVDHRHPDLASRIWRNEAEIEGNRVDDDGNSLVDDVLGWNFAENDSNVIDYKYLGRFSDKPARFFDIQAKILAGTATEEEKAWIKAMRDDKAFLKELQTFGNFVHGTHVAGIGAGVGGSANADARVMALKLIPTEVKLPFSTGMGREATFAPTPGPGLGDFLKDLAMRQLLIQLAKAQGTIFTNVAGYVQTKQAHVANLSLGTSTAAASVIIEPLLKVLNRGKDVDPAQVLKYAKVMVGEMVKETSKMAKTSPGTLFVIAAGNDGTDNDVLPVAPANIREPNTVTVAATLGGSALAPFSNYGATMVDLAAPGVGIPSAIPGGTTMALSGTSQAAPHVAHVAGRVHDSNPDLTVEQIRAVLMETVDAKDFLRGKVKSGGMVNGERAVHAARLMASGLPLSEAARRAKAEVRDVQWDASAFAWEDLAAEGVFALPLPSTFQGQRD